MNYLAHLHIASYCQSSLLGNLLGDFVKGDPAPRFTPSIVQGIKLHRYVDSMTDAHDQVRNVKQLFLGRRRRFSGIALDMFWDHCLSSEWQRYHQSNLSDFCKKAEYKVREECDQVLPERFMVVTEAMWKGRWLESYQSIENIHFALQRMSTRSPRMAELVSCSDTLDLHYDYLKSIFHILYPEILNASKRF
ncbi:DUF479 domain-containing protein [Vibrio sp. OCN044]|uniref:DUF479 domain-containing protein n=1 Tax=Vibrio tetraodonis subsp. pristinus TaxID=2695891 RepID=A0A6L8LZ34_9VIBR|nr:ACP phosphodiesterase [Vibrio tetraodonis]MYM60366.1 DUF479 domain-containing protein [Vibrio tetraodonis subsp. pristinus]